MKNARSRFIGVAVIVCLFASGMATFLDYYKYRSVLGQMVATRLLVVGYGIENSIQDALKLGLGFSELSTLPGLLERQAASDPLLVGIDVFDTAGRILYSTQAARAGGSAPASWLANATLAKGREWSAGAAGESVAGIALKNNFDLTLGYLAMRYQGEYVARKTAAMGRTLLARGLLVLACALAALALALGALLRRYERDMQAIDDCLEGKGNLAAVPQAFAPAVAELRATIADAEATLASARAGPGAR